MVPLIFRPAIWDIVKIRVPCVNLGFTPAKTTQLALYHMLTGCEAHTQVRLLQLPLVAKSCHKVWLRGECVKWRIGLQVSQRWRSGVSGELVKVCVIYARNGSSAVLKFVPSQKKGEAWP